MPLAKVVNRLDSLLFVLKSCKSRTCVRPWEALHPQGNVQGLWDALSPRFDGFYTQQERVRYDHCELGYILEAEGPQFEKDGLVYHIGMAQRGTSGCECHGFGSGCGKLGSEGRGEPLGGSGSPGHKMGLDSQYARENRM